MPKTTNHLATGTLATSALRYVFVYGTLRRGEQRDINMLMPAPVFIAYAQVAGTLYNLGDYPGLRLGGRGFVQGEVYQIGPALELQLDEIEEVWPQQTGEYVRREVFVTFSEVLDTKLEHTCLVYEIAQLRAAGMPVISSGDWLRR